MHQRWANKSATVKIPEMKMKFVSLNCKTLAKNPAQAPRSATRHPRSGDETTSNMINYFQTPSGPLRFFSFGVTACIGRITTQSDGYLSNATLPARQFPSPNATLSGIMKSVVKYSSISSTELLYDVSLSMQRWNLSETFLGDNTA